MYVVTLELDIKTRATHNFSNRTDEGSNARPLLNSLRGPIYVINSVNTKLPRYTFVLVSFVLLILATILFLCHNREVLWPKKTSTDPHFEKYLGKIPRWRTNLKGMNDDASLSNVLKAVKTCTVNPV